jgi:hypothetical protein
LWPNPGPKGFSFPSGLGHEFPKERLGVNISSGYKRNHDLSNKRKTKNKPSADKTPVNPVLLKIFCRIKTIFYQKKLKNSKKL